MQTNTPGVEPQISQMTQINGGKEERSRIRFFGYICAHLRYLRFQGLEGSLVAAAPRCEIFRLAAASLVLLFPAIASAANSGQLPPGVIRVDDVGRAANAARVASDAPITLDGTRQLFLDDYLIGRADNLRRITQQARKFSGNPVVWDAGAGGDVTYGSVLQDQGRFRMWYARGRMVAYAESADGLRWSMPNLDFVRIDGEKTNVLFASDRRNIGNQAKLKYEGPEIVHFSQLSGVMRTRESDTARRYLMGFISIEVNYTGPRPSPHHRGERRGFGVAASPDGLRWTLLDNWATETFVDGPTYWLLDPKLDRYVQYGRALFVTPEATRAWGLDGMPTVPMTPAEHAYLKIRARGRAVSRAESPDLVSWEILDAGKSPLVLTHDPFDPPGAEMYAMQVFAYQGLYIGMIKVWQSGLEHTGPFEVQLAVSRDGHQFNRVGFRTPFIAEGDVSEWDRFNVSTFMNDPILVGDEMRIFYSAQSHRHAPYRGKDFGEMGAGVGYATIQRDRFVSLEASFDGGTLVTKPLRIAGRSLRLNAKSDYGSIVIEALNSAGTVVATSKPWRRDSLDGAVEWETGALPASEPVALRFTLKNAKLFAVWSS